MRLRKCITTEEEDVGDEGEAVFISYFISSCHTVEVCVQKAAEIFNQCIKCIYLFTTHIHNKCVYV
jgi:hypothetical protein